jgi:HAD superfamily hydrolase (TIGR01509 family)
MTKNLPLIIFDCDGILVDSEPIANRVLTLLLNEIGLEINYEQSLELFLGKSWSANLSTITKMLGTEPPKNFLKTYTSRMTEEFHRDLKPVEGIEKVLSEINYNFCVASSGSHQKIKTTLGITGLLERFNNRIFSADDVKQGKPSPDLFLHACKYMNSEPEKCIVVEDALPGVLAAISAGMKVLGYTPTSDTWNLAFHGAITFEHMHQLPQLLENLIEADNEF